MIRLRTASPSTARSRLLVCVLATLAATCGLTGIPLRSALAKPVGKAGPAGPLADQLLADRPGLFIPEPLKPWVGWVLNDRESALCPPEHGKDSAEGVCTWPSRINLNLRDTSGTFSQSFRVYKSDWVSLPGSAKLWPQDVRIDGKPAVVVASEDDEPTLFLTLGEHLVTGNFLWDELPESLPVPESTGLIALTVAGKPIANPSREEGGEVYLHKEAQEEAAEALEIRVHRRITDSIPLLMNTRISLRIAGKSREVTLGRVLPPEFVPVSLNGSLPARLEADSRLKVQVRPGSYELTLIARHEGPVSSLVRPNPDGQWPADEVWVFEAQPDLRVVTVEGVPAIDPQQTTLPSEWKELPAFPMHVGDTMKLREERRGDPNPAPDQLTLLRTLWLDFDGRAYTAHDSILGTLTRTWRLELAPPTEVGRISVAGQDQVITRGSGGQPGVELRQGKVVLAADSRIPHADSKLAAVGWDADFARVSINLMLPPGWRLFHASGVDEVPATWLNRYTLLDLFLILLFTMAIGRLFGVRWGALALVALGLSCTEPNAPRWVFLGVLVTEALARVLKTGTPARWLRYVQLGTRIALVLVLVGFSAEQVRRGLHPALERTDDIEQSSPDWLREERSSAVNSGSRRPSSTSQDEAKKIPKPGRRGGAKRDESDAPAGDPESEIGDAMGGIGTGKGGGGTGEGTIGLGNLGTIGHGAAAKDGGKRAVDKKERRPEKPVIATPDAQPALLHNNAFEIDPNATVQTGPGLPRWQWQSAELHFSGPVKRAQELQLYLVPPWLVSLLLLGQVALLALLAVRLCGISQWRPGPRVVATFLFLLGIGLSGPVRAENPSDELLEKLQEQILKPPSCRPSCVAISRLQLDAAPRSLRLRLDVGVAATSALPLPGSPAQWLPTQVLLDGKPAAALRLAEDHLWLAVGAGSHQVIMEGPLPRHDTVQIELPLKPHRVETKVKGWQLDGVHEDGLADDALQLSRVATKNEARDEAAADAKTDGETDGTGDASAALKATDLPPYALIEREIQLGQKWQVATRILRVGAPVSAMVLEVPLLPGESVTTSEVRVQNGKVLVNLAPNVQEMSWRSILQEKPHLELVAAKGSPWSEVWRLTISPMYHVELGGIPVIHQQDSEQLRKPEWRPWPGEKVTIEVTRPEGIAGRSLTIDRSELRLQPGLRATDATLTVDLRTSRGGPHPFVLPPGAQLLSVETNGKAQPLQSQNDRLMLNLLPGEQKIVIKFQLAQGITTFYKTPQLDLGAPSVNALLTIELGNDRWPLFTFGPPLGPSVLFWSLLLVVALLAVALGRFGATPLRTHHYFLLGLGLTQVTVVEAAIVIGWLLALGYRQRSTPPSHWLVFNLRQLLLIAWTVTALMMLVQAITAGLLGRPQMQIAGNGSTLAELRWFADRSDGQLPLASVLSLPLRAYQAAMLIWALWLAQALLGWLRWGYTAFATGGLMRSAEKKPEKEPEPPPPSGSGTPPDAAVLPDVAALPHAGALPDVAAVAGSDATPTAPNLAASSARSADADVKTTLPDPVPPEPLP